MEECDELDRQHDPINGPAVCGISQIDPPEMEPIAPGPPQKMQECDEFEGQHPPPAQPIIPPGPPVKMLRCGTIVPFDQPEEPALVEKAPRVEITHTACVLPAKLPAEGFLPLGAGGPPPQQREKVCKKGAE